MILLRNPSFLLLALAAGAHSFVIYGHGNWMPPFLSRVHGMSSGEIGTWLAVLSAGPGVIGMISMGYFADWLVKRRPQARFEVAMASFALTIPFALLFMLAETVPLMLVGLAGSSSFREPIWRRPSPPRTRWFRRTCGPRPPPSFS